MTFYEKIIYAIALGSLLVSCLATTPDEELVSGRWRGEFRVSGEKIPFNFLVEDVTSSRKKVFLVNGDERAPLDSVHYKGDSVIIPIDIYDALLIGKISGDSLKGYLRKNQAATQGIPFGAAHNQQFRFNVKDSASSSVVTGKWSVNLISETGGKKSARYTVGLLEQKGKRVTGTILTTMGDYRYFEGVLDGQELKLSAFSGSNPSLIKATVTDNIHLSGEYVSAGGRTVLEAIKSDTAKLPDPYKLTYLKPGFDSFSFSFPDLNGNTVSLKDEKYKGKVVVVTVLGSWCPNCVDEAAFLAPWYKENKRRGVEIVGLAFERKDDIQFAKTRLNPFIKRFDIQYDILFGGISDKKVVAEKLPELNTFLAFPTTFFIDKKGKVRKVHTGYTGPATGKYYDEFMDEFNREVDVLVNESRNSATTL